VCRRARGSITACQFSNVPPIPWISSSTGPLPATTQVSGRPWTVIVLGSIDLIATRADPSRCGRWPVLQAWTDFQSMSRAGHPVAPAQERRESTDDDRNALPAANSIGVSEVLSATFSALAQQIRSSA
jgi:hypothetical protein